MSYENLIVTILFILPGFIITGIKHTFNIQAKDNVLSRTIESIVSSLFLYTAISMFALLKNAIQPYFYITINEIPYNVLDNSLLFLVWGIILIATIIGLSFGYLSKSEIWNNIYKLIFSRTYYREVWIEAFERNIKLGNNYVEIKLKSKGDTYMGFIEMASDFSNRRELFLTKVHQVKYDDDCSMEKVNARGMLISVDSIEYILFLSKQTTSE